MSIIQSLRDRAAVLLTALIAISLIGFLVQDAFIGRSKGLFAGRSSIVGTINGNSVDMLEFNDKVNLMEQNYRSRGMQASEMLTQNIMDGVWNSYIQEELIRGVSEQTGLAITSKEMSSLLFSEDAPAEFKQLFTNQAGQYDINQAKEWFNNLKKTKKEEDLKSVRSQLLEPLMDRLLLDKYNALFVQGAYVPKWMAEKISADNDGLASIGFVSVPYPTISDSLAGLKITDAEINDYVAKHKDDFKQEKSRAVSYVVFDANPSAADSAKVLSDLIAIKETFRTTTDVKGMVVRNNSKIAYYDGFVLKSRMQMSAKDTLAAMPDGSVFGPYLDGGNYNLARKLETRSLPDSIKVRHILISTVNPRTGAAVRTDSAAKKLADSLFAVIKTGGDWKTLAASFSDDEGSKANGGEYNFASVDMVSLAKEYADYAWYKKVGDKDVVKSSQFGYFVMEVLSQKNFQEGYKLAYISKPILASEATDNAASAAATKFSGNSRNLKAFEDNVTKDKLTRRTAETVREMDYSVAGMPSRQVVKWIFENNVGSVSEPFDLKDKYVVFAITDNFEEGVQPASIARMAVEPILRNQKKGAEIIKKTGSAATLEAIATANTQAVGVADSVKFSDPFIKNLGSEPRVIGASFDKNNQTKVSGPIEGTNGVYWVKVNSIGALPNAMANQDQQRKALEAQIRQYAGFSTMDALKKAANIKDTRRDAGY